MSELNNWLCECRVPGWPFDLTGKCFVYTVGAGTWVCLGTDHLCWMYCVYHVFDSGLGHLSVFQVSSVFKKQNHTTMNWSWMLHDCKRFSWHQSASASLPVPQWCTPHHFFTFSFSFNLTGVCSVIATPFTRTWCCVFWWPRSYFCQG